MLDSLLTLTLVEAGWLLGALILTVLFNRGITLVTGRDEPIFLVIAVLIFAALVITSIYTAAKWVWHRLSGGKSDPKA